MTDLENQRFMRMAIETAREGIEEGQTPFGACIVKDGEILSCAHNTVWETTDITAHAEINAIREACLRIGEVHLEGSTIYSTCEPCPMCFSACHWACIGTIIYGAGIEDAREAGFHELVISAAQMKAYGQSSMQIVPDFLRDENVGLFDLWRKTDNSRIY